MRTGKLKNRISIYSLSRQQNEYGEFTNTQRFIADKWADVKQVNLGRAIVESDEIISTKAVFKIRYDKNLEDYSPNTVVKWKNREYEIQNIMNYGNKFLNLITVQKV